jgi:TDG/mug DNA glycosylase family protein
VSDAQPVPDYLRPGLKLVIVGINPGIRSGATGHHYAFPGNHFWPVLYEAGIIPEPITFADDRRVLEWDIGLTNIVHRATQQASDLSREEMLAGAVELRRKLEAIQPRAVCFNGKSIYQAFAGKNNFDFGLQPEALGETLLYVVPSSSARTAAYQRPAKVEYWRRLRELIEAPEAAVSA